MNMKKEKNIRETTLSSECTTIIVGDQMSTDGSRYLCRSSDFDAMMAINYEFHENTTDGPTEFVAKDSGFRCPLPKTALGYTALPDYQFPGEWGSAGFNTVGVGMSSTETIFSSQKALECDPYVKDGLAENCTYNIVLPYIHTAREGVERLGKLIEEYGSAEGFGIGFIDDNEIWYLENACGHRWLACKMPRDQYFVTGNQSRFRDFDPNDKENFLASDDLISFAEKNGLYDPKQGKFDFHEAYSHDCKDADRDDFTYNYPRVWGIQKLLSPSVKNDVSRNTFPVFAKADEKISLQTLRKAFRFHYDGTAHDPYLHNNGKEPYRPVSIFRTTQTHIIQVRPNLPQSIGHITYVALGMADLGVFLPLYQGVKRVPEAYTRGRGKADHESAYWKFRKVMTLGMVNYNAYAPIIKDRYAQLEIENDRLQHDFEAQYLVVYKDNPQRANTMLQQFSDRLLHRALDVADHLLNELFTQMTFDTQNEYLFHGA
jgi:putative dipeptidase|nr:C69 family dipeptidase [Segatella oris]